MFPLHIWLPDAMEGPTPVSALIHAATMVVAGVYLVARLFPVFHVNEASLLVVHGWGSLCISCRSYRLHTNRHQTGTRIFHHVADRLYDVCSWSFRLWWRKWLGYTASMFHLFTHAFFKSLLFLGAGAVIHYMHSNEMKDMGGLRKFLPVTHITFFIACLAIAGIPPFAGFFSKEEILMAAYRNQPAIYYIGLITSGITAFYMFRLYFQSSGITLIAHYPLLLRPPKACRRRGIIQREQ